MSAGRTDRVRRTLHVVAEMSAAEQADLLNELLTLRNYENTIARSLKAASWKEPVTNWISSGPTGVCPFCKR